MAKKEHLAILRQGVGVWNSWRGEIQSAIMDVSAQYFGACPNLENAHLNHADLREANLVGANLSGAHLDDAFLGKAWLIAANLERAYLRGADLSQAKLYRAYLGGADLSQADLREANLTGANLRNAKLGGAFLGRAWLVDANLVGAELGGAELDRAILVRANLHGAYLVGAQLVGASLDGANLIKANLNGANLNAASIAWAVLSDATLKNANLTGCVVHGVSAWDANLEGATQKALIITRDEPRITVDNLELAQFIYLLLRNEKIRDVIDAITSKVVLILGRFTDERKAVLDALKEELRQRDYLPVLFDFDKPASKDLTGTIQTLANMARFVIADLTDPSSVPHELATVVPATPVAVQPILLEGQREYAMFPDLRRRHHWVLEPYSYTSPEQLMADLSDRVIVPAEAKARELRGVSPPTA